MADVITNPEGLQLTFGIEIEMLFLTNTEKIRADPAYHYILPEHFVEGNGDDLGEDDLGMIDELWTDDDFSTISPLLQAANILRHEGLDLAVHVRANNINKKFDRWMLTTESKVLHPWKNGDLAKWSEGRLQAHESSGLRFHGIELVSRILKAPSLHPPSQSADLSEVVRYANVIAEASSGEKPYQFISRPENAGVHVHVGLHPKDGEQVFIPVGVLRHLAWIVVCFEDVISLLHHPERHGYKGTKIFNCSWSNRTSFGSRQWEGRHHSCAYLDMEAVFSRIFNKHDTPDQDLTSLRTVMCSHYGNPAHTKGWFVSFFNIKKRSDDPKITVEFRQHHGTLDAEDLRQWVIFVTALMRTAERKANEPETNQWKEADGTSNIKLEEMAKYPSVFGSTGTRTRTLKELFDLMDMPIKTREYWWERAKKFRNLDSTTGKDYNAMSLCEACGKLTRRDCAGWVDGELDLKPWDEKDETQIEAEEGAHKRAEGEIGGDQDVMELD
ncbi:hypothetical protein PV11_09313 [Exophiala sideris]|uniref:Uncharacterized protein n=1 Tax=Exophiala sideris TaxID=1016849 RepID=A0A0D1YRJ1_9EURO|nr:hypothetical protein PV11_09313 [Exophiala sideris]